jgi:hypothetical protein
MGFDNGGVKNSKLFEALATSSWNLAAGVETPERDTGASQFDFLRVHQGSRFRVQGFLNCKTTDIRKPPEADEPLNPEP